jgi:phosphopantothenoylcysteine decarboxylase/phosphopantothenate--cysteine ligase
MLNKKILIGICGGIAAYKTLSLIRLFRKAGCEVKVVATQNALSFVTPLTIETLSNNRLYVDMFEHSVNRSTEHISLAQWADVMIVAPATANIIGKLANGIADDALSTTLLAYPKPVYIAPAMNENMYKHPAVQRNMDTLKQFNFHIIAPESGMLACNTEGIGRMAEPETIFNIISETFVTNETSHKKRALVTAGPTYEPIDAVRFIGNHSSGLMGFSLAEVLAEKGFEVDLITGHTHLDISNKNINRIDVNTAEEMLQACLKHFQKADIIIMSAAVADYTPEEKTNQKIKKGNNSLNLKLKPTTDILKTIASQKTENQIIVGFALETENELDNAKQKLHTKNLDFIILNSLNDNGAGFGTSTNKVTIIDKNENITELPLKSKQDIAADIIRMVVKKR